MPHTAKLLRSKLCEVAQEFFLDANTTYSKIKEFFIVDAQACTVGGSDFKILKSVTFL